MTKFIIPFITVNFVLLSARFCLKPSALFRVMCFLVYYIHN